MKIGAYTTHPAADTVRLMDNVELDRLAESIRLEGLRHRIVLYVDPETGEELVLDGRNRLRACLATGVDPLFTTYTLSDPYTYVALSRQRESMSATQRAVMAADMLEHLQRETSRKGEAVEIASELCGVSESYVDRATTVKRRVQQGLALDELYEALREDEAGLSEVRELAEAGLHEQVETLAAWKSGAHESLREAVAARRPAEPADTRKFTAALKAWVEARTKSWTADERAELPSLVAKAAESLGISDVPDRDREKEESE